MKRAFADIATTIDQLSGRPLTFGAALLIIAAWRSVVRCLTSPTRGSSLSTRAQPSLRF
jgi:hypothetical protein